MAAPVRRLNPVGKRIYAAGSLYWASYIAIWRRDGLWTNYQGDYDFNGQLVEPVISAVAPGWERAFTRRLARIMKTLTQEAFKVLRKFHKAASPRAQSTDLHTARLDILTEQLNIYEQLLKQHGDVAIENINTKQKDINREFKVPVEEA